MGGKVWSEDEERVFWTEIIPTSTKRNLLAEPHIHDTKAWSDLCHTMQRAMGRKARRKYTGLMLYEHFFQNSVLERFSPNAAKFVRAYIRSERTTTGKAPSDRSRSINRFKQRGSGSGRRPRNIVFDEDLQIEAARAVQNLRQARQLDSSDTGDNNEDPESEYQEENEEPETQFCKGREGGAAKEEKTDKVEPDDNDTLDVQSFPLMADPPSTFRQPGVRYPVLPLPVPSSMSMHPPPAFRLPPLAPSRHDVPAYYEADREHYGEQPRPSYQTLAPYEHPFGVRPQPQYALPPPYQPHEQHQSTYEAPYEKHRPCEEAPQKPPWFSATDSSMPVKPEPMEPRPLEPGIFPVRVTYYKKEEAEEEKMWYE